jgi:hypothetical protein
MKNRIGRENYDPSSDSNSKKLAPRTAVFWAGVGARKFLKISGK